MPDFTFTAPDSRVYPETRDAAGRPLGLVNPGDIRDLDEAPDHFWRETTDEDRAEPETRDDGAGQDGSEEQAAATVPEDSAPGPQPVPTPAPPAAAPTA